jgi:hypothetical protein
VTLVRPLRKSEKGAGGGVTQEEIGRWLAET